MIPSSSYPPHQLPLSSSFYPPPMSSLIPPSGTIIPPLSDAFPNENDIENNESLISYLVNNNVFETALGQERRDQIVHNLYVLAINWVGLVGRSRGYDESVCRNGGGVMLKIFGSQKLRVHSPEADMDILCVAPSFVSRYDFFTSFCQMLESLEGLSLLLPIPEAYTPVIKFNIGNQAIDMIFVSLPIITIPPNINFQDNHLLLGMDEQGVRSLNGYRVAERLLTLVPNVDAYCVTLAAIKHWAKRRGIYANILGFLGGVNFAILVAHVCQMHINSCPATLVKEFFKLYNQWKWPNGILLTYIEDLPHMDGVYFPSWNSKVYPGDKMHLMPIITPTAPAMNSAYNVGEPQKFMILREVQRGNSLFANWKSRCESSGRFETFNWEELFVSGDLEFFQQYTHYIQIDVSADTPTEHRRWFGWCESRLRQLILSLHQPDIMCSRPYSNCFHRRIVKSTGMELVTPPLPAHTLALPLSSPTPPTSNEMPTMNVEESTDIMFCSSFFIGLSFSEFTPKIDLTPIIQNFLYRVSSWNAHTPSMEIDIKVVSRATLPRFIFESIALPSSTSGCTPSKTKLRSDSTTIPPCGSTPYDETADKSSLTPSILSLTDRLHVTFADNIHSELPPMNGTPIASKSSANNNSDSHSGNSMSQDIQFPHGGDEEEEDTDTGHGHRIIAKTIFRDDCDSDDEMVQRNLMSQQKKAGDVASPSGRIKKHINALTIAVEPRQEKQEAEEPLPPPNGISCSPCKRSRSS